jgi:hypothetical protein
MASAPEASVKACSCSVKSRRLRIDASPRSGSGNDWNTKVTKKSSDVPALVNREGFFEVQDNHGPVEGGSSFVTFVVNALPEAQS